MTTPETKEAEGRGASEPVHYLDAEKIKALFTPDWADVEPYDPADSEDPVNLRREIHRQREVNRIERIVNSGEHKGIVAEIQYDLNDPKVPKFLVLVSMAKGEKETTFELAKALGRETCHYFFGLVEWYAKQNEAIAEAEQYGRDSERARISEGTGDGSAPSTTSGAEFLAGMREAISDERLEQILGGAG